MLKRFILIFGIGLILYSFTVLADETEVLGNKDLLSSMVKASTDMFTYSYPESWNSKESGNSCVISVGGESTNFAVDWRYPYMSFTASDIDKDSSQVKRDDLASFLDNIYKLKVTTFEKEINNINYYGASFEMPEEDENDNYILVTKIVYFDKGEKQGYFEYNYPKLIGNKKTGFSITEGDFSIVFDEFVETLELK